jgi:hypothetical protein
MIHNLSSSSFSAALVMYHQVAGLHWIIEVTGCLFFLNVAIFFFQAWCKFYENAMSFNLVPPASVKAGRLNSVHLCEAPGAFITSLNHYLKLHNPGIDVSI